MVKIDHGQYFWLVWLVMTEFNTKIIEEYLKNIDQKKITVQDNVWNSLKIIRSNFIELQKHPLVSH